MRSGQPFHDQPVPLATQPGGHRLAAVGGQPVPEQGRFLPAEEAAQLAQGLDEGVGVVGVRLMVKGEGRAAAAGAVAQAGRHRRPLPVEVVVEDGGDPAWRPGAAGDGEQGDAGLVPEHDGGPTTAGVAADPRWLVFFASVRSRW